MIESNNKHVLLLSVLIIRSFIFRQMKRIAIKISKRIYQCNSINTMMLTSAIRKHIAFTVFRITKKCTNI